MVFYFTGTGNSLYVAKQLEGSPISIPQVMRQENMAFAADAIGVVAPVYGHEVPPMVKEFLKKATFQTEYFYMILTYGNRHGGAAELAHQLCRQCGIPVAYINVVLMVDNWLPSFDMGEQMLLDKQVENQLGPYLGGYKNPPTLDFSCDRSGPGSPPRVPGPHEPDATRHMATPIAHDGKLRGLWDL